MTDVTSRGYPKNFRNLNGCNVYGVFDRHRRFRDVPVDCSTDVGYVGRVGVHPRGNYARNVRRKKRKSGAAFGEKSRCRIAAGPARLTDPDLMFECHTRLTVSWNWALCHLARWLGVLDAYRRAEAPTDTDHGLQDGL